MMRAQSPFVGVVHLSNTHFPYVVDPADAPFQPQSQAYGPGDAAAVHNRYRDAIHRQDAIVARLVRGIRTTPGSERVAVVFVSDHGEQIRERGAVGHTWGVLRRGAARPLLDRRPLGPERPLPRRDPRPPQLRALESARVTQLDVLPTVLDLMGIWDAPVLASLRQPMAGESLLRGGSGARPVVLTNCSGIFACAFKNWGALAQTKKLVASENDEGLALLRPRPRSPRAPRPRRCRVWNFTVPRRG